MRPLIDCANTAQLYTGASKCNLDFEKMKGAILVEEGAKLPTGLTATKLEELAHADGDARIYGILTFTEYAKNGGEVQTSANGYGGEEVTGVSARKDTYTLNKFQPALDASLTQCSNKAWGAYFFDDNNVVYGISDGTETLAPFPMKNVYSDAVPHPTSSAKSSMTVTFAHENAKKAKTDFNFFKLDFNPQRLVLGLTKVKMEKTADGKYKIYEEMGGIDVTRVYGKLIAKGGNSVLTGATSAATYDEANNVLTIASAEGAEVRLKSASVLFANDIKGIEQA